MNAFHIKIIAILTMITDHIGFFFFPEAILFRFVGRVSFPLFAWLIANGTNHTRSVKNYLIRILLLALVSQLPYIAAHRLIDGSYWALNIVFTLFLGLAAIQLIKKTNEKLVWVIIALLLGLAAQLLDAEYGAAGVMSIIIFYLFYGNVAKMMAWQTLNFAFFYLLPVLIKFAGSGTFPSNAAFNVLQMFGLLSIFFIAFYNQKEGLKAKWLFYLVYPLQYVIIYLLKVYII